MVAKCPIKGLTSAIPTAIIVFMDIKAIREKYSLTQEELAAALGVSFSTVNRWENNRHKPSKLAEVRIKAYIKSLDCEGGGNNEDIQ